MGHAYFSRQKHPFHILPPSELPILTSTFLLIWLFLQVLYFQNIRFEFLGGYISLLHLAIVGLFVTLAMWFVDIINESVDGEHTAKVQRGLRLGFILFIVSEVMLFFAVFWGFFHFSLVPSIAIGAVWPPLGTQVIDVWYLPFINTNLLLMSGFAVTLAHMDLLSDDQDGFFDHLTATIIFGLTFLWVQGLEYKYGVKFSWRGNIYGSIFFMSTGFHGMHVTVGILFLFVC
jgi:heme/copper-type cytochrome/quinol oxidase subunit 3